METMKILLGTFTSCGSWNGILNVPISSNIQINETIQLVGASLYSEEALWGRLLISLVIRKMLVELFVESQVSWKTSRIILVQQGKTLASADKSHAVPNFAHSTNSIHHFLGL